MPYRALGTKRAVRSDRHVRFRMTNSVLFYLAILGCLRLTFPADDAWAGNTITVGIYVDEEEPATVAVWRDKLTKRVVAASEIIGKYCDVRFVVKKTGRWLTDNQTLQLSESLAEFEKRVPTNNVRLAIGFTSQYRFRTGRDHLGGTRGPLMHHILIRESAKTVLESERLEVLVHELGHFLCAAHSSDPNSAMRPVVGDGKARSARFQIGFDPANAAILRLVGQELRDQHVTNFAQISPRTLSKMRTSYLKLNQQLPKDPAAPQFLRVIDKVLAIRKRTEEATPVLDPTKVMIPVMPSLIPAH